MPYSTQSSNALPGEFQLRKRSTASSLALQKSAIPQCVLRQDRNDCAIVVPTLLVVGVVLMSESVGAARVPRVEAGPFVRRRRCRRCHRSLPSAAPTPPCASPPLLITERSIPAAEKRDASQARFSPPPRLAAASSAAPLDVSPASEAAEAEQQRSRRWHPTPVHARRRCRMRGRHAAGVAGRADRPQRRNTGTHPAAASSGAAAAAPRALLLSSRAPNSRHGGGGSTRWDDGGPADIRTGGIHTRRAKPSRRRHHKTGRANEKTESKPESKLAAAEQ